MSQLNERTLRAAAEAEAIHKHFESSGKTSEAAAALTVATMIRIRDHEILKKDE